MAICPRCAALGLCCVAVVKWGPLGDKPESNRYEGRARRLAEHETRIIEGMPV